MRLLPVICMLAVAAGCGGGTTTGSQGPGGSSVGAGSGSSSTSGNAAGSSTGSGAGSATGSSGATGTSSGGASSTGTSTGDRAPDFIDGGYVFCRAEVVTDAGDAQATWMCPPGTYFCESPGSCAQCRADADCADDRLPTYEPSRNHCDLDSGVAGYQSFCQRCVGNADCAPNPVDSQCDMDPRSIEPGIEAIGFETCIAPVPGCPDGTQPAIGACASTTCTTDSDCADAVSIPNLALSYYFGYSGQQALPFCVDGQCANSPDDNQLCPNCYCGFDSYCHDPRAICDAQNDHCACTGLEPVRRALADLPDPEGRRRRRRRSAAGLMRLRE